MSTLTIIVFLGFAIGITALVENEQNFFAAVSTVAGIFASVPLGYEPIEFAQGNWQSLLLYGGIYLAIGILIWAPIRWLIFLREKRAELQELESGEAYSRDVILSSTYVSRNKANITSWMVFWIFDLSWQVTKHPIKFAGEVLYNIFHGIYEKMRTRILKDFLPA
jgi:hypothetical protein